MYVYGLYVYLNEFSVNIALYELRMGRQPLEEVNVGAHTGHLESECFNTHTHTQQ